MNPKWNTSKENIWEKAEKLNATNGSLENGKLFNEHNILKAGGPDESVQWGVWGGLGGSTLTFVENISHLLSAALD